VIAIAVYYFGNDGEGMVRAVWTYGIGAAFWIVVWRIRDSRKTKVAAPPQP
jgi:hypothetical protein